MAHQSISDRFTTWEWDGELICDVSSRRGDADHRWVEIALWELDTGGLLLRRTGQSAIYHTEPTKCTLRTGQQRGHPGTVDGLRDDAWPCEICNPRWPEDLDDNEQIRVEDARHEIVRCRDIGAVTDKLTTARPRSRDSGVTRVWSEPVRDLLTQAQAKRPDLFSSSEIKIA